MPKQLRKGKELDDWLLQSVRLRGLRITRAHQRILELCFARPAAVRHRARSAVFHIRCAWALKSTDREMAAFRAMTAEEESVTAIFHSLRRLRYVGAGQLLPRNHIHKAALDPFIKAVNNAIALIVPGGFKGSVEVDVGGRQPKVRLKAFLPDRDGVIRAVYPDPPLEFTVGADGTLYDFSEELKAIQRRENLDSALAHLRKLANRRNQILYASDKGVPQWDRTVDAFVRNRTQKVLRNLTILLLIDLYPVRQVFAQQCLDAFLKMLKRVEPRATTGPRRRSSKK